MTTTYIIIIIIVVISLDCSPLALDNTLAVQYDRTLDEQK
jgi:hypothetical protein